MLASQALRALIPGIAVQGGAESPLIGGQSSDLITPSPMSIVRPNPCLRIHAAASCGPPEALTCAFALLLVLQVPTPRAPHKYFDQSSDVAGCPPPQVGGPSRKIAYIQCDVTAHPLINRVSGRHIDGEFVPSGPAESQ